MEEWRPDGWVGQRSKFFEPHQPRRPYYKTRQLDYEAGADAILKALKPLILEIAPSSKLIDVLYKEK